MAIRSTVRHARAAEYLSPGGAWDVPALDPVLSPVGVTVVDETCRLHGAEAEASVSRVVCLLAERGIGRGSVVCWQAPNSVAGWLLYRACWRLGAIAAPIHHGAGRADVDAALHQVPPDLLLADPGLPAALSPGVQGISAFLDSAAVSEAPPAVAVESASLAVVLFTSGSTGRPKAVLHTHRGLVGKARTMAAVHGLGPHDAVLMPAPLAHISGLLNGVLVPGVAGMKTVLMSRWDPTVAVELIETERITFMIGPPTFFVGLMEVPGFSPARVASLRLVSSGGAGVTPSFVATASARLGCRIKRTYGSTEAPTVTTSSSTDSEDRARETDGRPTGAAEVQIVVQDTVVDVVPDVVGIVPDVVGVAQPGVVGEVWLRGPELCEGYVDPDQTASAFTPDGWFRTGDMGVLDAEGWLTITGRMSDVIIRGGENIGAAELEAVLEAHPAVRQAVAVGYPDPRLGQRVCVFVLGEPGFGLEECRAWMTERGVTRFKWPERVVVLDTLPILGAGKVDRAALERHAAATPDSPPG